MSAEQNRLAVESRAYPLFRYDPDAGKTPEACFDLDGNPAPDEPWPSYTIRYREGGREKQMTLPMTFADFAVTEVRFRKHFRVAPPDTWNDSMVPLAEFLEIPEDERDELFPYLWSVDRKNHLSRLLVDHTMVESAEDRRDFWTMLRSLAGVGRPEISREEVEAEVRQQVVGQITSGLMRLAGGVDDPGAMVAAVTAAGAAEAPAAPQQDGDYLAPWIDTPQCTSCDECVNLNPRLFAYDTAKKAFIKDSDGGPFKDVVRAAERCTARVIHPGLPRDRSTRGIDKWIKRAERYN
jgi:pyruvate-ferredoxin/flavodoxin oxidoreductase